MRIRLVTVSVLPVPPAPLEAMVPPEFTVTPPTDPEPARAAELLTVMALAVLVPLTLRRPALIVVAPK